MDYRIDKEALLGRLRGWDGFLKRKVHLIACGGTALALLGVKPSTKDVDLLVPDASEYDYLIATLKQLGYVSASGTGLARGDGFIFDLFKGKRVHTTELLESPLEPGNHILLEELNKVYLGILNYYDIIISKLFRATAVDIDDCLMLARNKKDEIDFALLGRRFRETASFDISEDKVNGTLKYFFKALRKEGPINEK